jgi:hypothetical protein
MFNAANNLPWADQKNFTPPPIRRGGAMYNPPHWESKDGTNYQYEPNSPQRKRSESPVADYNGRSDTVPVEDSDDSAPDGNCGVWHDVNVSAAPTVFQNQSGNTSAIFPVRSSSREVRRIEKSSERVPLRWAPATSIFNTKPKGSPLSQQRGAVNSSQQQFGNHFEFTKRFE